VPSGDLAGSLAKEWPLVLRLFVAEPRAVWVRHEQPLPPAAEQDLLLGRLRSGSAPRKQRGIADRDHSDPHDEIALASPGPDQPS